MAFAGAETGRLGWATHMKCKESGLPHIPFLVAEEGVRTAGGHTKSGGKLGIGIFGEPSWPHILLPVLLPPNLPQRAYQSAALTGPGQKGALKISLPVGGCQGRASQGFQPGIHGNHSSWPQGQVQRSKECSR